MCDDIKRVMLRNNLNRKEVLEMLGSGSATSAESTMLRYGLGGGPVRPYYLRVQFDREGRVSEVRVIPE